MEKICKLRIYKQLYVQSYCSDIFFQENFCPNYGVIFVYQVNLTANRSISKSVDHNDCPDDFCNVTFSEGIDEEIGAIKVSVLATSELGPSELICFPYTIGKFINYCMHVDLVHGSSVFIDSSTQQYFVPQVLFVNNQFEVQCISTALTTSSQTCGVRYTTDPLLTGLSDEITSMLDTPFSIPGPSAGTTYYFEFSLLINSSLQVVDHISFIAPTRKINVLTLRFHNYCIIFPGTGLSDSGIALVVLFSVIFPVITVVIVVVIIVIVIVIGE